MSELDLRRDASVLLMGRSGTYPALSVALGERIGVVGALSVEAAAKHLSTRDIDGIVLGDGFTPRVIRCVPDRACGGFTVPQPARSGCLGRACAQLRLAQS
jgi:hypothetical protein